MDAHSILLSELNVQFLFSILSYCATPSSGWLCAIRLSGSCLRIVTRWKTQQPNRSITHDTDWS